MRIIICIISIILVFFGAAAFASSSATYSITRDCFANGGYIGSASATYALNDIIAQDMLIGNSISPHYYLNIGRYIFVDNSFPYPPVITSPADDPHSQDILPVSMSGTCNALTNKIHVDGAATGVTYTAGDTTWSYSGTLTGKSITYSVTALDALGNESTADTRGFTLNTARDDDSDSLPHYWEVLWSLNDSDPNYPNGTNDDSDHDGQTNYNEYLADSDPLSGTSLLKVDALTVTAGTGVTMQWSTSTRRNYRLYYSDNAYSDSMTWSLATTITGTGSTYSWTDNGTYTGTSPLAGSVAYRYYKISVYIPSNWTVSSFDVSGMSDPDNLAGTADVVASSEYSSGYRAELAIDGVYGAWDANEWASRGEMTPWIWLFWNEPMEMNKVVLYDRCNPVDHIKDGWMRFYRNGSLVHTIHIGTFPYGGGAKEIIFDTIEADSVKLQITDGIGLNVGMSEFMVFYDTDLAEQKASNLASSASVTVSSEYGWGYRAGLAVDGIYGAWDANEWASRGEMTPWIKLQWQSAKQMNKVTLYDRCNPVDHIRDAWLDFYLYGGLVKTLHVGTFPYGGGAKEIIFGTLQADSITLRITDGTGLNIGLSEIMVFNDTTLAAQQALNLASSANVTASSEYNFNYRPQLAVDGVYGMWDSSEWGSNGEMTPWIRLNWSSPHEMNKVVMYDRCNPIDHIKDAWLEFYLNGSLVKSIHVGTFPYGGGAKEIIFSTLVADSIKLRVTDGTGLNVGLSEIMVFKE